MDDVEMYLNPKRSQRSEFKADPLVAHLHGLDLVLRGHAKAGAAKASVNLAEHRRWGDGHSEIGVSKGDVDYHVFLSDAGAEPDGGGNKALAIEGETNALSRAFGIPPVRTPNVRRGKGGRFIGREEAGEDR